MTLVLITGTTVWWWMPDKPARLPGLMYWTSPSTGMDFVYIAPGTFMMGSPESEKDREDSETQHEVTITKGFWLGVTEVTQGQWKAVMGSNPSEFKGRDRPVESMSWDDCQAFIAKLCEKEGVPPGTYRLPTEAQWEYACRAGTTGPYAGDLEEMAWYVDNSSFRRMDLQGFWYADWSKGLPRLVIEDHSTAVVGKKVANAWGLYDMHGNVEEWCGDWHGDYKTRVVADTAGPDSGFERVYRGGGWGFNEAGCRSAFRDRDSSCYCNFNLGFRLLRLDSSFPSPR